MKIEQFQGQFRWLSNFWFCDIIFEGIKYPTVEHAYQAAKYDKLLISHIDIDGNKVYVRDLIRQSQKPGEAKKLGKKFKFREDWEQVKVSIMKDLLREKFKNPYLREKLIATKDWTLEEGNHWHDTFWGIYPPGSGDGQNMLGKLIMEVREEIRKEKA